MGEKRGKEATGRSPMSQAPGIQRAISHPLFVFSHLFCFHLLHFLCFFPWIVPGPDLAGAFGVVSSVSWGKRPILFLLQPFHSWKRAKGCDLSWSGTWGQQQLWLESQSKVWVREPDQDWGVRGDVIKVSLSSSISECIFLPSCQPVLEGAWIRGLMLWYHFPVFLH